MPGLVDAMRFWEPRRLAYNAALGTVVVIWLVATWPHFRPAFGLSSLPPLAGLAFIANVLHCAMNRAREGSTEDGSKSAPSS